MTNVNSLDPGAPGAMHVGMWLLCAVTNLTGTLTTTTNGAAFLASATATAGNGATWDLKTAPHNYLATNASFTLSSAYNAGAFPKLSTAWLTGTMYITNSAGSASPIVCTLSGSWSTCLWVTNGMANAFAITNDAYITVCNPGPTNAWAQTR